MLRVQAYTPYRTDLRHHATTSKDRVADRPVIDCRVLTELCTDATAVQFYSTVSATAAALVTGYLYQY